MLLTQNYGFLLLEGYDDVVERIERVHKTMATMEPVSMEPYVTDKTTMMAREHRSTVISCRMSMMFVENDRYRYS